MTTTAPRTNGTKSLLRAMLALTPVFFMISCGGGSSSPEPSPSPSPPQIALTRLSTDTFTNPESQHATEVEPGMAVSGSTLVTAFQVGRRFGGGASDIGFATSTNGGASWTSGLLQGITQFAGGTYLFASDPSVAFDQSHGVWIIATLDITATNDIVSVSRSADAMNWAAPIIVSSTPDADKEWIACDNTASSAFYGRCYLEWDDPSTPANGLIWMSTSADGGLTWSAAVNTARSTGGIGGQPVVQPNGTVVVPTMSSDGNSMLAFTSTDGGASWNAPVTISSISDHVVAGNMRTIALPSAAVDSSGRVYVVWQDCRFRTHCASNDIVLSTSSDGSNWTAPAGIPIDSLSSAVDHFIPVIAVDPTTSGASVRLAVTYYFYPTAQCTTATCQLEVGVISSANGGASWGTPTTLAGPMSLSWLPNTSSGVMVGDYFATAFSNGHAYSVFAVAQANTGTTLNESIFTTTSALPLEISHFSRRALRPELAVTRKSDHGPRKFYDLDNEHPIPQRKK